MDITLVYLLLFGLLLLLSGYFLQYADKKAARILSWSVAVLTVVFSAYITAEKSALYRMAAIVSLQLLSMKGVVMVEAYHGRGGLNFLRWCAFALGWFGMRPALFEQLPSKALPSFYLLGRGISRIIAGFAMLYLSSAEIFGDVFFLPELLMLIGFSLILHFGMLNLMAAFWRWLGVDARELFRAPYKSKSLQEFWGKRWNIAFSEMTALIAYRPLKQKLGPDKAMIVSFLLSGILHEIAISLPVNAGYGLPLLYFSIHGFVMYFERTSALVKKIIAHRLLSHVWVMGWLVVPMPILFHAHFIEAVMVPLRDLILRIA
jgi:hypothetical protein